jgi:hypothetical protein
MVRGRRLTPALSENLQQTVLRGLVLACLLWICAPDSREAAAAEPLAPGFRQLDARHLTLITDLPASDDIDELPRVFDAAFGQWCEYFGVDAKQHADWHVTGYLMQAKERFQQAGYWRNDLPPFPNGFSTGEQLWLYNQTSPYYRRHLLLHEGVHSFMYMLVGQAGPPWYMEGIAELLGTHRWQDGQLTVGCFPATKQEMQDQGRMKIVQDDFAAGRPLSVADVLAYSDRSHLRTEAYGWSWALAAFLDGHPRYHQRFHEVAGFVRDGNFAGRFRDLFADDWQRLADEWQAFIANVNYGYDFERMAIEFAAGQPLAAGGARRSVAVDRGWQSSGVRLEAGKRYRLTASGRYQVAQQPDVWWCESGGVTIRYYHGQPLGILLAAVHPDRESPAETEPAADKPGAEKPGAEKSVARSKPNESETAVPPSAENTARSGLAYPTVVGLGTVLSPERSGTLYLRINERAGALADNAGELAVEIRAAETPADEGSNPAPGGKSKPVVRRARPAPAD